MNYDLIKVRIVAFVNEAFALFLYTFVGVLASNDFQTLVIEHTGATAFSGVAILLLNAGVKHMRNLKVLREYDRVGGTGGEAPIII